MIERDRHPDTFQQELGQKVAVYKCDTPVEMQQIHPLNTVEPNASERVR